MGYAYGNITIPGVDYNTTVTNNTLPTLDATVGGAGRLQAYVVPTGTTFDPGNPGTQLPRFLIPDKDNKWRVVTNQKEARLQTEQYAKKMWSVTIKNIIPGATISDVPAVEEVVSYCSDQRLIDAYGYADSAACQTNLTTLYNTDISDYLSWFDTTAVSVFDWSPLPDGAYDIYFYEPRVPINARFPSGLIIDTIKPEVTITIPGSIQTGDFSPAIMGKVNDPKATIIVSINGKSYPVVNKGDGTWILGAGIVGPLAAGSYDVTVQVTDQAGNVTVSTVKLEVRAPSKGTPLAATGANVLLNIVAAVGIMTISIVALRYKKKPVDFS